MSDTIYGIVGVGVIPQYDMWKHYRRGRVLWRQVDGTMEFWSYTAHRWVGMDGGSTGIDDLMSQEKREKAEQGGKKTELETWRSRLFTE